MVWFILKPEFRVLWWRFRAKRDTEIALHMGLLTQAYKDKKLPFNHSQDMAF